MIELSEIVRATTLTDQELKAQYLEVTGKLKGGNIDEVYLERFVELRAECNRRGLA